MQNKYKTNILIRTSWFKNYDRPIFQTAHLHYQIFELAPSCEKYRFGISFAMFLAKIIVSVENKKWLNT